MRRNLLGRLLLVVTAIGPLFLLDNFKRGDGGGRSGV